MHSSKQQSSQDCKSTGMADAHKLVFHTRLLLPDVDHLATGLNGKNWNHFYGKRPSKVKQRVRKGVPNLVRGLAWQMLAGSHELAELNPGRFCDSHTENMTCEGCSAMMQIACAAHMTRA